MKLLRIDVKVQIMNSNGTYVDLPFQTANILVKYWKNAQNTHAVNVLTYSYEQLSSTKQFPTAIDSRDNGRVDIETIYNYQNQHSFLHVMGNQISDVLFVLAVYRFTNNGLTETFGMSTINDTIKITLIILKANQSDVCPQICSSKTFCPASSCFCSQQFYSGCNAVKKKFTPNINDSAQTNSLGLISKGEIKYIQIDPQPNGKQWFSIQLEFSLQSNASATFSGPPKDDRIFIIVYLRNRNTSGQAIPNIYNFDFIDSPSLGSVITSQDDHSQVSMIVNYPMSLKDYNHPILQMKQKILLSNSQILTCAIYYLNDSSNNTSQNSDSFTIFMNTDFTSYQTQNAESVLNLALIIGMVVLGMFVLILLICLLHFVVAKRFRFWDVFSNHVENSNRNSVGSVRFSRDGSSQDRMLSLPTVSYDFLQCLVFKPLKYIYSTNLQQNNSKIAQKSIKKLPQHDEICSICLQEFITNSKVKYTYCGHILHSQCIDSWLQKQLSCPLCRQKLQSQDIAGYEDKILQEIVQNNYYQGIIDQQALIIKTMYKKWRRNRNIIGNNNIMEITQESLMNNQKVAELDRTDMNLQFQNTNNNQKAQKQQQIVIQNTTVDLNSVFTNNQLFSIKRLGKNYLFYRCIFLHLQIHKNFQNNSELNLYHSDLAVEKDRSILSQSKFERNSADQKGIQGNRMVQPINQLSPQPYFVRNHDQHDEMELQLTTNFKKDKSEKTPVNHHPTELGLTFNIDFLQPQRQLTENKSEMYLDNNSISSQSASKAKQEKSDPSQTQQRKQLRNRRNKRITMREEMNQLERELQQSEQKQPNLEVKVRFSDNQSIIRFDDEEEENHRYIQAPISIVTGSKYDDNKSQSSKNCAINKTQVLVFSHRKKQPQIGEQTLKTLPHSVCLNDNLPLSYRKFSHAQQYQKPTLKLPVKQLNLENI